MVQKNHYYTQQEEVSNIIKIGDNVRVLTHDKVILVESTKVTNISPCKKYIQTEAGLTYMPASQIEKI